MGFKDDLSNNILIGDGAMGTLLYSYGVDFCFEQLNTSQPDKVQSIHEAYLLAGADVIQTNTYGANIAKLSRYGLEDQVRTLNTEAVRLAKNAVSTHKRGYVLGTIGGIHGLKKSANSSEDIVKSLHVQLDSFLNEGVDGLIFETFYDFDELTKLIRATRKITDIPVVAQVSIHEIALLQNGTSLTDAFSKLEDLGADVVGLNCRLGPYHMIQSFEQVPLPEHAYLSAFPNASLPDYVDGKFFFETDTEYFVKCAVELRNQGVRFIGGCCGTTPNHIHGIAKQVKTLPPITKKHVREPEVIHIKEKQKERQPHIHELVAEKRTIIVELDPPKNLNTTTFFDGVKALRQTGADALTLADNSLASPRISNLAMATLVKNQYESRPLIHITCRDRNLIGLQSHILGLHTLGINQVLAITGDPAKVGDFPGATSVYDLSSFELIRLIKQCNEGISFSGQQLMEKTDFSVAGAFNPNVRYLDRAVQRLEKKIEHGADYFISQPVYSHQQILEVYEATKHLTKPIFIGIMPLVSSRNAEFLHNEVPGIKLSNEVRAKMAECEGNPDQSKEMGIQLAKELIDTAFDLFHGIYLITPFMRYEMTVELTKYIKTKEQSALRKEGSSWQ